MAIVHDFPTERQVPPSPSLLHQLKASQEARVIGIRLHSADRTLQRATDCEWSGLTLFEKGAYDTKGAIALNLGDQAGPRSRARRHGPDAALPVPARHSHDRDCAGGGRGWRGHVDHQHVGDEGQAGMNLKRAFDDIVQLAVGDEDEMRAALRLGAQLACEAIVDATSNYDRPEMRALTDRVLASLDDAPQPKPLLDLMTAPAPMSVDAPGAASVTLVEESSSL